MLHLQEKDSGANVKLATQEEPPMAGITPKVEPPSTPGKHFFLFD